LDIYVIKLNVIMLFAIIIENLIISTCWC